MEKFIDKCLRKIMPRVPSGDRGFLPKIKISSKIIQKESTQMINNSIRILEQSKFHKNKQIRGYVCDLLNELNKDHTKKAIRSKSIDNNI